MEKECISVLNIDIERLILASELTEFTERV